METSNFPGYSLPTFLVYCILILFPSVTGLTVSVEKGAMTTLFVATHPLAPKIDGSYFDECSPVTPSKKAR